MNTRFCLTNLKKNLIKSPFISDGVFHARIGNCYYKRITLPPFGDLFGAACRLTGQKPAPVASPHNHIFSRYLRLLKPKTSPPNPIVENNYLFFHKYLQKKGTKS